MQLIISHYEKNLSWLDNIACDKVIYTKSNSDNENYIKLKNVGREPHTFFHHIIENYDSLSDWTFFSQDDPFDHVPNFLDIINNFPNNIIEPKIQSNNESYFFGARLECQPNGIPHHPGLDLSYIWSRLFIPPIDEKIIFTAGVIFCVSKSQIQSRSVEFYKDCLDILLNRDLSPWEFERIMPYIFNNDFESKI